MDALRSVLLAAISSPRGTTRTTTRTTSSFGTPPATPFPQAKAHLNYLAAQGARGSSKRGFRRNRTALELAPNWLMANVYLADTLAASTGQPRRAAVLRAPASRRTRPRSSRSGSSASGTSTRSTTNRPPGTISRSSARSTPGRGSTSSRAIPCRTAKRTAASIRSTDPVATTKVPSQSRRSTMTNDSVGTFGEGSLATTSRVFAVSLRSARPVPPARLVGTYSAFAAALLFVRAHINDLLAAVQRISPMPPMRMDIVCWRTDPLTQSRTYTLLVGRRRGDRPRVRKRSSSARFGVGRSWSRSRRDSSSRGRRRSRSARRRSSRARSS